MNRMSCKDHKKYKKSYVAKYWWVRFLVPSLISFYTLCEFYITLIYAILPWASRGCFLKFAWCYLQVTDPEMPELESDFEADIQSGRGEPNYSVHQMRMLQHMLEAVVQQSNAEADRLSRPAIRGFYRDDMIITQTRMRRFS